MKSALLVFGVATAALPAAADRLIVVKVGGTNFVAKVEDTATGRAFMEKLPHHHTRQPQRKRHQETRHGAGQRGRISNALM